MIDIGLLVSAAITLIVLTYIARPEPTPALTGGVVDTALGAVFVGLAVGRVAALLFDDPGSVTSFRDVIVIRSGVEFWPGVAAGIGWLILGARREGVTPVSRLAALAPWGLVAWACYEATCLLRDGCPGPASPVGLRPDGISTRLFPVGLAVALVAGVIAFALQRQHRIGWPDIRTVLVALAGVAAIRTIASIWLPHIGRGPTRQHLESIAIMVTAIAVLTAIEIDARHRTQRALPT